MVHSLRQIKSFGFTLIEVLVVIAIIGIMSSVIIAGALGRAGSESAVRFSLEDIQATLEQARDYARKGKTVQPSGYLEPLVPAGGYGVELDNVNGRIKLFADLNSDGSLTLGTPLEEMSNQAFNSGFVLTGRVECLPSGAPSWADNKYTFIFRPVSGEVSVTEHLQAACVTVRIQGQSIDGSVSQWLIIKPGTQTMYVE